MLVLPYRHRYCFLFRIALFFFLIQIFFSVGYEIAELKTFNPVPVTQHKFLKCFAVSIRIVSYLLYGTVQIFIEILYRYGI
jgi:hypothetical protein